MSKTVRVAFSGAQSTGKTTLLNALRESADFKDCKFWDEITRQIKEQGFEINEQGTDATQLKIMQEHKRRVQEDQAGDANDSGLIIFDRCSLDGLVYTQYLYNKGQVSKETLDEATRVFEETIADWDAIFFLRPEFEVVDDGVRSVNVEFHRNIVFLFDHFIEKYKLQVIQLTGSVEDRVQQFKVELSKLL
nr:MAG TPA: AAA domain protein [Caudoviricetes sp.]